MWKSRWNAALLVAKRRRVERGRGVLDLQRRGRCRLRGDQLVRVLEVALHGGLTGTGSVGRPDLLALLPRPDAQLGGTDAEAVDAVDPVVTELLGHLRRGLGQVVPGPGLVVRHRHPGLLQHGRVDGDREVGHADRCSDLGAVHGAGLQHLGVHRRQVELVAQRAQVGQRGTGAVRGDVGLVHLDHVGRVVGRGGGGELVPVRGPLAVLHHHVDAGIGRLERVHGFLGEPEPGVVAPGRHPQRHGPVGRSLVPAARCTGGRQQTGQGHHGREQQPVRGCGDRHAAVEGEGS